MTLDIPVIFLSSSERSIALVSRCKSPLSGFAKQSIFATNCFMKSCIKPLFPPTSIQERKYTIISKLRLTVTWEDHQIHLLGCTIRNTSEPLTTEQHWSILSHPPPFWIPFHSWSAPATLAMLAVSFSLTGSTRNVKQVLFSRSFEWKK